MPLKLYGLQQSFCTLRALLVLAEKGVTDFEFKKVDLYAREHKTEAFLELQPFGQVPVLDDDGFILFESRPVARYLAKKFADQGPALIPAADDVKAWALFEQWASVEVNNFDTPAVQIYYQKMIAPLYGKTANEEIISHCRTTLTDRLAALDKILGKQAYMGGDSFSLIDIFYMPMVKTLFDLEEGKLITERENVKAWWERVSAREAWKSLFQ